MALTLYRRHTKTCKHRGKSRHDARARNCDCPIWVQGTLGGQTVRRSLDQASWEAASRMIAGWTAQGEVSIESATGRLTSDAVDAFLRDAESRKLNPRTVKNYRNVLRGQLLPWCVDKGYRHLRRLRTEQLGEFRTDAWATLGQQTQHRAQNVLRMFFRFCQVRGWVTDNPTQNLSRIVVREQPTLPFTAEEWQQILDASEAAWNTSAVRRDRLRALLLLMRYSGLRVGDAVTLERNRLHGNRLLLYQAKTGTPVYCPLPPAVMDALQKVQSPNPRYFFWGGRTSADTVNGTARSALRRLFKRAGVAHGHPHMLRDTYAVSMLEQGVPLENVSMLLGHTSIKVTEKHYRPWVLSLQTKLEESVRKTWPTPPPTTE